MLIAECDVPCWLGLHAGWTFYARSICCLDLLVRHHVARRPFGVPSPIPFRDSLFPLSVTSGAAWLGQVVLAFGPVENVRGSGTSPRSRWLGTRVSRREDVYYVPRGANMVDVDSSQR